MWIFPILLLTVAFFLLYKYATKKFDYWEKRNFFYLKPVPFFGNILDFMATDLPLGRAFSELCKRAGNRDFFGIFIFGRPALVVRNPTIVRSILQRDFATFSNRSSATSRKHPVMSNAIFVQRDSIWKNVRAKLTPIFTSGKLKLMFSLMAKECQEMNEFISKVANIPDVESKEICARLSTNIITRCAFAVEANSFKDENAIFRQLGRQMFDFRISTAMRQMGVFFAPDFVDALNIPFFDTRILDKLKEILMDVLNSRRKLKHLKGNDFVDTLLEVNRKEGEDFFSDNAILGQAIQFYAAGFETVSSTISFTLYELCVNPDIQERLRNEIKDFTENSNGLTYESLNEMKYLDMVVSETLRKYAPVPFLDRRCNEDYKIEGTDFVIEKGTPVYIPVYDLQYNPEYFPDPEKYDPERFADKSEINKDGLFYLPFGEGPRICIGQRFGLLEIKIAVSSVLTKYRLERSPKTPEPIKYAVRSIILQSTVGIPIKFVPLK